ncbi:MAG: type II toxin-antitoxin system mRNA interferase toxin, RelE/StbE family [Methylocystaceae bacterium]|nr:type II toxin-antitoxin system mRNA interferase toxin, RelE/StbE family [Methylocystaceae bacterium]
MKDLERLLYSSRNDVNKLKEAIQLVFYNNGSLPHKCLDHPLIGDWSGHRECDLGWDFLLTYMLVDSSKTSLVI